MTQWITIPLNRTSEATAKERPQAGYMTLFKACPTCIIGWKRTDSIDEGTFRSMTYIIMMNPVLILKFYPSYWKFPYSF